jgi:anti-sigma B factor antagonist
VIAAYNLLKKENKMAELKYSVKKTGDIAIISFDGYILLGSGDVAMRDAVKKQLTDGLKMIIIDLSKVGNIDSTGIGELVGLAASARRQSGEIRLACLTKRIRDIMEVVRLNTIFSCHETVDEAVESFKN